MYHIFFLFLDHSVITYWIDYIAANEKTYNHYEYDQ